MPADATSDPLAERETPSARDTDLKFFTNTPEASLLERFRRTLADARFFDVLVGYFRVSGFHRLHDALSEVETIRILVGLNVGRRAFDLLGAHRERQQALDFASHARAKEVVGEEVVREMEACPDEARVEVGARRFIAFLNSGRMQIRAYPTANVHAKVYISRFGPDDRDFGRVITGSSNFSASGLVAQREFNVELKDRTDVAFALSQFEALWAEGVEVTEEYVEALQKRTWLADDITPYDVYLKFLYAYFREDINLDVAQEDVYLPDGFMDLAYQRQAVTAARKILEAYGGVFLADVVGLGKTFIAALLAQRLAGKILVVAPPVLMDYWRETFFEFGVRGYQIVSLGKLHDVLASGHERFDYVFIDEAHRFRNEETQRYEMLHEICLEKKVVLVSATPLNNTLGDIFSQLKLFQKPRRSTIPGVPNLERFFRAQQQALNREERGTEAYAEAAKAASEAVRDRVLKHVMVRRTRTEIARYYSEDMQKQGLAFPDLAEPRRLVYAFDEATEAVFQRTIARIRDFQYARYTPFLYLKKGISPLEAQSQRNVGGFMKSLLVKRLESSFHAFKRSIGRFIASYERFIAMVEGGTVYVGKDINVFDLLDRDDEETLQQYVDADRLQRFDASAFRPDLMDHLQRDLALLRAIAADWAPVEGDPKLDRFVEALREDPILREGKLIVFTESKETAAYLHRSLDAIMPGEVFFYASGGGQHGDASFGTKRARDFIRANYDPNAAQARDDVRLLVTTDVLAEGINLHRSNVVLNYDLPWNPTKVLQRAGRVNRVGTAHDEVFVYNFFPTTTADEHLGLEANVKAKIQAFHDTLGEDAKYLTDDEELGAFALFGEQLYRRLNDRATYEGETEEGPSELRYLKLLRDLRDHDPERFKRIKALPKKARAARMAPEEAAPGLVTFFRRDKLKKFFAATDDGRVEELTFFEAADRFACAPDTPAAPLPADFFERLARNKDAFDRLLTAGPAPTLVTTGRTNEKYILDRLKAKEVRRYHGFVEEDQALLATARRAFEDGIVPRNTSKRIKQALETTVDPRRVLGIVRENIPAALLRAAARDARETSARREVILSAYLR